ncbi:MAG: phenylalanine--tRNA ligase subunit beta [Planctomycetes bacterium]|jgi:phenylalanyl-tRNA synthetase beta chain|nr:phenylalanine--tRNA ligase subunit beta [Planctomycetota bacterium]
MKISLDWLSDYIDTGLPAEQIAAILSNLGLPCEGIEHRADDVVIDVEVTSNRGDCLSHIGIARELAAATGKTLRRPEVRLEETGRPASELVQVEIREPDWCRRYTARVIEGVKIAPSPDWVRRRLEAVGLRSINNVVDATNYAMMEGGQPPHAFDYATIEGRRIIVRRAAPGEQIVSIDGSQCALTPEMLVIADARRPVAVAGIMGGLQTEVGDATTTILLEEAYFDPLCIRTTARRLALPSEASFRFERIVDIENIDWASRRTAQLIVQLAGGRVAPGVVDAYPRRYQSRTVRLRLSRLGRLLGIEVPTDVVLRILSALQFRPQVQDGVVVCAVPTWRSDIEREVDLIEEVARVHGYDQVPTCKRIEIEATAADPRHRLAQSVSGFLNGSGFYETINIDFVDEAVADLFVAGGEAAHLGVRHVTRKAGNLLRRTLLGSLLQVLRTNVNAGNLPCRIYEIADTFVPTGVAGALPRERAQLGLVVDGELRRLRGAIEGLVGDIRRGAQVEFVPADLPWAQVGARVLVDGQILGEAGVFSEAIRTRFDFKDLMPCGAELDFDALMTLQGGPVRIRPIPRFPAIERDLSVVIAEPVLWTQMVQAVRGAAPAELEEIRFVDIYRGKGITPGSKSVTLSLRFRDEDGTLTHETVDRYQAAIVENLARTVGAELRTL